MEGVLAEVLRLDNVISVIFIVFLIMQYNRGTKRDEQAAEVMRELICLIKDCQDLIPKE